MASSSLLLEAHVEEKCPVTSSFVTTLEKKESCESKTSTLPEIRDKIAVARAH